MVVSGQIVPDSFLRLRIGSTQSITDNSGPLWVNSGFIEVYDKDTNLLEVLSNGQSGFYQSLTYKPQANRRYLFKLYGLNRTAWVDETVPDDLNLKLIDTSSLLYNSSKKHFKIQFELGQIPVNQAAYYSIQLQRTYQKINGSDTQYLKQYVDVYSSDLILTEDARTAFNKKDLLLTNRIIKSSPQLLSVHAPVILDGQVTTALDLTVKRISLSAFDYYSSMYQHLFYQNNPFLQPNALNGNAVGAYGALLGVNSRQIHIEL